MCKTIYIVAALLLHYTSNYTAMVHPMVHFYHAVTIFTILVFVHGAQRTVLHHFAVSKVLLSQYI